MLAEAHASARQAARQAFRSRGGGPAEEEAPQPPPSGGQELAGTRQADRTARDAGVPGSLLLRANLLRAIPGEGIRVAELPAAARISRRIVKAWLGLEKQGWLTVKLAGPGPRSCGWAAGSPGK